jgi:hypothetical protein
MEHEMEHTSDPICASAIAAHHLVEHPDYYPALDTMEQGLSGYTPNSGATAVWAALSIASTGASAYHGYKRNDSVGWAIVWGLLGGLFPVITPAVALAQGFGEPKE